MPLHLCSRGTLLNSSAPKKDPGHHAQKPIDTRLSKWRPVTLVFTNPPAGLQDLPPRRKIIGKSSDVLDIRLVRWYAGSSYPIRNGLGSTPRRELAAVLKARHALKIEPVSKEGVPFRS